MELHPSTAAPISVQDPADKGKKRADAGSNTIDYVDDDDFPSLVDDNPSPAKKTRPNDASDVQMGGD